MGLEAVLSLYPEFSVVEQPIEVHDELGKLLLKALDNFEDSKFTMILRWTKALSSDGLDYFQGAGLHDLLFKCIDELCSMRITDESMASDRNVDDMLVDVYYAESVADKKKALLEVISFFEENPSYVEFGDTLLYEKSTYRKFKEKTLEFGKTLHDVEGEEAVESEEKRKRRDLAFEIALDQLVSKSQEEL